VPVNKDVIQKSQIQILSTSIKFDYPIEYVYACPQCGGRTNKKAYETASTNTRLECPEIYFYLKDITCLISNARNIYICRFMMILESTNY
jgi:hypothetical protein